MSVYSGFATRQQETSYNQHVERLIMLLQKRVIQDDLNGRYNQSKQENIFLFLYRIY